MSNEKNAFNIEESLRRGPAGQEIPETARLEGESRDLREDQDSKRTREDTQIPVVPPAPTSNNTP